MVVGGFRTNRRRSISPALYWQLIDALLPDLGIPRYPRPLSGQRVIDASLPIGPIPPGYGVETYLNLTFAAAGRKICLADLGEHPGAAARVRERRRGRGRRRRGDPRLRR
jgi:hypothetical protein